jgi:acyl dehydratase
MNIPKADPTPSFSPETLAAAGFPAIGYDVIEEGVKFRSSDRLIRPEDVEAYAFAVEDHDPWFFAPGPYGNPIIHPTLLANQALLMRHNHYFVPAGLHAQMIYDFVAPIPLGVRARTLGRMAEKYMRRDKPYMVTEYETASEEGEKYVSGRFVQMIFKDETAPSSGSSTRTEPPAPQFDASITHAEGRGGRLEVGQVLPVLSRNLQQRQIDIYSGVQPLSIHTDESWAHAKGFRTTIAQGMMSTAYISTLMTSAVGEGFVVGGHMDAKFLRPVFCGDTLSVTGTVSGFSRENNRIRVHVTVAALNQSGEQTLAATTSALCYDS